MRLSSLKSPWAWGATAVALVVLWFPTAYPRSMLMAYLDHARGHHEVQTFGYPAPWRWEYGRLLEERYGVKLHAVAGCCVGPTLVAYVNGYNSVSVRLAVEEHGRDIFEECDRLARDRWEAGQLDP